MIAASDVAFHPPPSGDSSPDWAETNFFGFHVPELDLCGCAYVVVRPGLGVAMSDVTLFDRVSIDRKDCLHTDTRHYLPAPADLADYRLANGLAVRAVRRPRDYELSYDGPDGVGFELTFTALMEPREISTAAPATSRADILDTHFRGHFDMTGRVTGALRLPGSVVEVDCIDTMDHSWGPRPEVREGPGGCWLSAQLDAADPADVRAVHCLFTYDQAQPRGLQYHFVAGYVLDGDQVREATRADLVSSRVGHLPVARALTVTDDSGATHRLRGTAVSGTSVGWFAGMDLFYVLYRWTDDSGRVGHGAALENLVISRFRTDA